MLAMSCCEGDCLDQYEKHSVCREHIPAWNSFQKFSDVRNKDCLQFETYSKFIQ